MPRARGYLVSLCASRLGSSPGLGANPPWDLGQGTRSFWIGREGGLGLITMKSALLFLLVA